MSLQTSATIATRNLLAYLLMQMTSLAAGVNSTNAADGYVNPLVSCRAKLNIPTDAKLVMLENIVGIGWDNLRNVPMGTIFEPTYNKCQTTPDSQYLVPDNVEVVSDQRSIIDLRASYHESYQEYIRAVSDTVNLDVSAQLAGVPLSISGSFGYEQQDTKKKSIQLSSSIVRARLEYRAYTLVLRPSSILSGPFKRGLLEIQKYSNENNTRMVEYLSQVLVRDFGTHVIKRGDVGVEISQNDFIDVRAVDDSKTSIDQVTAAVSASFKTTFKLDANASHENKDSLSQGYTSSLRHSEIKTKGGPDVMKIMQSVANAPPPSDLRNMTLPPKSKPEAFAIDDVVALDRAGELISQTVLTSTTELDRKDAARLSSTIEKATKGYYNRNTHTGCTDPRAVSVNFTANANDSSQCRYPSHNYSFYGLYQNCTDVLRLEDCYELNMINALSSKQDCTSDAEDILVGNVKLDNRGWAKSGYSAGEQWALTVRLHWCRAKGEVPPQHGYMFGGIFMNDQPNPLTGAASCPGKFSALKLVLNITMCTSRNYEIDLRFAIDFGGFVSCETEQKNCPDGFTNYFLTSYDVSRVYHERRVKVLNARGCDLYYCIKPADIPRYTSANADRPPYMDAPGVQEAGRK